MKKFLPILALALGACSEAGEKVAGPQFELVDESIRIDADDVNAHVYGSFALNFTETVGTPGGWGVITTGPANFPGNPKNAGTCDNGLWINAQGKRTAGSLNKPHPHCVGQTVGTEEEVPIVVVLEPISARFFTSEDRTSGQTWQRELWLGTDLGAKVIGNGAKTEASGTVIAYAIDAATLNGINRRVGMLEFDMVEFNSNDTNHFEADCTLDDVANGPRCLNVVLTAKYTPLPSAEGGIGEVTENVTGFLYWSPALLPYNYGSN